MKKINLSKIIGTLLIAVGLLVFLSPELIQCLQKAQTDVFIKTYDEKYGRDNNGDGSEEASDELESIKEADPLYQEILSYNQSIFVDGQSGFADPWNYQQSPIDISGFEDGIFGYIEIPSMGQTFELYIGSTMDNMSKGVAIMGETSIPVGGPDTNCVIAGHRGYNRNKTFFKDIEDIEIGDMIYITNPWEKLTYRVESIDVVEPYDADAIRIQPGKDMVTLLTCHPYMSHGRYRYLVYCERYEEGTDSAVVNETEQDREYSDYLIASDGAVYPLSRNEIDKENFFRRLCAGLMAVLLIIVIINNILDAYTGRKKRSNKGIKEGDEKL